MRAVRSTGAGRVAVLDQPLPEGSGVRVRVRAAGICGTDLAMVGAGTATRTLGHEVAGITADGRPVAVQPNVPCDGCPACDRGDDHLCRDGLARFHGVAGLEGGMADELLVAERCLHELPPGLSPEDAVLAEPLAVALHGAGRLAASPPSPVLVVGGGTIGICAAACAAAAGFEVDLLARHAHQRDAAAPWVRKAFAEPPADSSYAAVLEAAGTEEAMRGAIAAVATGGEIVAFGAPGWSPRLTETSIWKELEIRTTVIYRSAEFAAAVRMLAGDPRLTARTVRHRFPLESAAEAFAVAADRAVGEPIKVVLTVDGAAA